MALWWLVYDSSQEENETCLLSHKILKQLLLHLERFAERWPITDIQLSLPISSSSIVWVSIKASSSSYFSSSSSSPSSPHPPPPLPHLVLLFLLCLLFILLLLLLRHMTLETEPKTLDMLHTCCITEFPPAFVFLLLWIHFSKQAFLVSISHCLAVVIWGRNLLATAITNLCIQFS